MTGNALLAAEVERQSRLIAILRRRLGDLQPASSVTSPVLVSARGLLPIARETGGKNAPTSRPLADLPRADLWPTAAAVAPLAPPAPSAAATRHPLTVVAFSLCGLSREASMERIAELAARCRAEPGLRPLVLVDDAADVDPVRRQGWAVELLPNGSSRTADQAVVARRLLAIAHQWGAARLVDLGRRALPWPVPSRPLDPAPTKIVFFKDYSRLNPYQRDLYAHMPGVVARPGSIGEAVALQQRDRKAPVQFHLHWEEAVYRDARNDGEARAEIAAFVAALDRLRSLGGRVIWTIHNEVPHENRFPTAQDELRNALVQRADLVHVHGRWALARAKRIGVPAERLVLAPHGCVVSAVGRRRPARRDGLFRFGFVGAFRAYKGFELLAEAFASLNEPRSRLRLVSAGPLPHLPALDAVAERVEHLDRRLSDAELAHALASCDVVVLPYQRITTSGSAMLALGLGVPVILPDLGDVGELVIDGESGFRFKAGDAASLAFAMRRAMGLSRADLRRIGVAGRAVASVTDWSWVGRRLAARVRALAGLEPTCSSDHVAARVTA